VRGQPKGKCQISIKYVEHAKNLPKPGVGGDSPRGINQSEAPKEKENSSSQSRSVIPKKLSQHKKGENRVLKNRKNKAMGDFRTRNVSSERQKAKV